MVKIIFIKLYSNFFVILIFKKKINLILLWENITKNNINKKNNISIHLQEITNSKKINTVNLIDLILHQKHFKNKSNNSRINHRKMIIINILD